MVVRDFDGKQVYAWGQYAFDNAHIGWQDYIRRAAEWQAREFGAVGLASIAVRAAPRTGMRTQAIAPVNRDCTAAWA